jgi:uncharacterized protein YjiS (DUF1127 family)
MSFQSNTHTNTPFTFTDVWSAFSNAISMAREWQARRGMRKTFGEATDRQLRDAGLIRQDVEDACGLPLLSAAEAAITVAARKRSGNW